MWITWITVFAAAKPMSPLEWVIMLICMAILLLFSCVAISMFVTFLVLRKYSSFGETDTSYFQYAASGIKYDEKKDNVPLSEKKGYFLWYGEDPYKNRKHVIPEILLKNGEKDAPEQ